MDIKLPRILSPNLGCPIIVSLDDLMKDGVDVVIAESADAARSHYGLVAKPSCPGEGQEFELHLGDPHELTNPGLPPDFNRVEQTRWQISTTLRASVFAGKARFVRFSARPAEDFPGRQHLRTINDGPYLITLYDLVLRLGGQDLCTVFHVLALRPSTEKNLRFIHATDLHVALRNDLYEVALQTEQEASDPPVPFVNFNKNLRRFIQYANYLADRDYLDFVLLLGDLVDFKKHNYSNKEDYGENNWRLLCDILTGKEARGVQAAKSPGIKVPVFTCTGNHDWRFFPYPPATNAAAFGLEKKTAKALNPFWADDPEELTKATKEFYQKMIEEGALLSNLMLGGSYLHKLGDLFPKLRDQLRKLLPSRKVRGNPLDWLLPRMATWKVQVLAPLIAGVATGAKVTIEWGSVMIALVSGLMNGIMAVVKFLVRWKSPDLMALEAGWEALADYFLQLNPYYNYAFRVDRNYFLILDTGFDCLRAQRFWDDGRKKLGRLTIKDNILGGSPDSMGFFDANEFYPYSQIAWMERLLLLIRRNEDMPAQIFIGLHAPPINLSQKERDQADEELARKEDQASKDEKIKEILLEHGSFNIRYGTINHYLSQFLRLCLFGEVSLVLAGHAHWRLECSIFWDSQKINPLIYYGRYTDAKVYEEVLKAMLDPLQDRRPLILQTPAIGPVGDEFSNKPPYFRWIVIDEFGTVQDARVRNLDSV